jgi:hypothetical protein
MASFSNTAFSVDAFSITAFYMGAQQISVPVIEVGGSKPRKRIRGPYSDPLIFEEYIKRCIAEREVPRADVATAMLQESLIEVVQTRKSREFAELETLLEENQLLMRLLVIEGTKRNVTVLEARRRQVEQQLQKLHDEEETVLLALFDEM